MIVTCEECSTSFQLDESRIPATGAQVRCSRCKHAFFLPNPSISQSDAVHSIAEEAAAAPVASVPAAIEDLGGATQGDAIDVAEPAPEPELDEEDWQFSEEIRVEGDDLEDDFDEDLSGELSTELDGESDFGETEDFGAGLDDSALTADTLDAELQNFAAAGTGSGLELDSGPEPIASEPPRDESNFGSVDDFSELMQDEETPVAMDLAAEIASELEEESAAELSAGTCSESGPTDDLGDPESWDLVGNDEFVAPEPAQHGVGTIVPIDADEFFSDDVFADEVYADDISSSSIFVGPPLAQMGRVVGWVACVALVGGVLVLGLQIEWSHWAEAPQVVNWGALQAETTSAGWVDTSRSGPILRFEGQIRNTGAKAMWPGVIQLALLDGTGERLTSPPIQARSPVAQQILREAGPDLLGTELSEASRHFEETPLAPGEVRRFEALVRAGDLPEDAQRVLLEMGEAVSRPARIPTAPLPPDGTGASETTDVSTAPIASPL